MYCNPLDIDGIKLVHISPYNSVSIRATYKVGSDSLKKSTFDE